MYLDQKLEKLRIFADETRFKVPLDKDAIKEFFEIEEEDFVKNPNKSRSLIDWRIKYKIDSTTINDDPNISRIGPYEYGR